MSSEFEKFNELPPELKIETAQSLSNPDLVNLAMTSKYHLSLFQPMIDIRKLLHHVVHGNHEAVQTILKKDMNLIFKRGKVTDCSGREFENVSAFEYALWALDKHMWAAMIECIPQTEEGRKVFAQLIAQYKKIDTDGVTYKLNGNTITEQHFDFNNTLIKELQTQVDSKNAPGVRNWEAINKQWREGVGGAQKLLPMHIVDVYCSNGPFHPVPEFTSQPKSSKQFYNWVAQTYENWFSIDSKLSVDFAVCNATGALGCGVDVASDLVDMTALCKIRTNDFINLKSQLEDEMRLDNHHQASQTRPN